MPYHAIMKQYPCSVGAGAERMMGGDACVARRILLLARFGGIMKTRATQASPPPNIIHSRPYKRQQGVSISPRTAINISLFADRLAGFAASFMPHQWYQRGDQIAVQAAQGALAVSLLHNQNDAGIRGSLRNHRDALARQRRNCARRTHGINR